MFSAGPASAEKSAERFKQSGMEKYMRKDYAGAVGDFDKYLGENPSEEAILLLRGLSKSLITPEDVAGACADFLRAKAALSGMNVKGYCAGQPGW